MAFDLRENAALLEPLHEVLCIRRVQIQRRSRLERSVDRAKDEQELVVVDMLREIESECGVELARMRGAKRHDVATVEGSVADAKGIPAPLRRAHELL